jgi:malate dehydrogenase (oxaloacetate-decarboxylating)(NADP+)
MYLCNIQAAIGIANLTVRAMLTEGCSLEEARSKIWMMDIDGLLVQNRPEGNLQGDKAFYAKDHKVMKSLLEVVKEVVKEIQPTVLIGAAAAAGAFNKDVLEHVASYCEKPIIFALSNPTAKAECTAEQAYTHTQVKYRKKKFASHVIN